VPDTNAPLLVLGGRADGHARVVIETAQAAGFHVAGFLSDAPHADEISGVRWLGPMSDWPRHAAAGARFHLGFGSTVGRRRWSAELAAANAGLARVVHPRACVSPSARVADGAFIAAGAVIVAGADVGAAAIVNHGAVVEHDAAVGPYALIGPGFACGGRVKIGEGVVAGVGSRVVPDRTVARWCWLGAGAVVAENTAPHGLYVGVPAKRVADLGDDEAPREPST